MAGRRLEFAGERRQERVKKIKEESGAAAHDVADIFLHQCAEYHGAHALLRGHQIDLADSLNCLVNRGDKWHSHLAKFDTVELRHETVAHRFCGNTRLIGNKEYGSFKHGNLFESASGVKCFI
jgi:hypothetical protein